MAKSNLWTFRTYRPWMKIWDTMRNPKAKRLFEAYENDTIENEALAKKFDKKHLAYASLDFNPANLNETRQYVVAEADVDGDFITDDPLTARRIYIEVETLPLINHPVTKKPVKYELDKSSPPVPSEEECNKILAERAKTEQKTKASA
jgi:hypothetical protein